LFAEKATSEELLAARRQDLQLASAALAAAREDQARAQSDLQALRTQRASLRLVSPVDGLVTARDAEPGTTLVAGQAVVEVVDPTSLWVNTRFRPGQCRQAWPRSSPRRWRCARAGRRPWPGRCCAWSCAPTR
jgi:multidrug resistance efflux pump